MWIGISISGFYGDSSFEQLSLFEQAADNPQNNKSERIDKVMDSIRNKHGVEKITFGTLMKKE